MSDLQWKIEAMHTPGYSVRYVKTETIEPDWPATPNPKRE